jgi:hypothetical protein
MNRKTAAWKPRPPYKTITKYWRAAPSSVPLLVTLIRRGGSKGLLIILMKRRVLRRTPPYGE